MGFLFGTKSEKLYMIFYMSLILIGALVSLDVVINLLDGSYAMMAIPTMISTLLLSGKVKESAKRYFKKLDKNIL
jgi:AGCS family alanine or glycine:cation symporter